MNWYSNIKSPTNQIICQWKQTLTNITKTMIGNIDMVLLN